MGEFNITSADLAKLSRASPADRASYLNSLPPEHLPLFQHAWEDWRASHRIMNGVPAIATDTQVMEPGGQPAPQTARQVAPSPTMGQPQPQAPTPQQPSGMMQMMQARSSIPAAIGMAAQQGFTGGGADESGGGIQALAQHYPNIANGLMGGLPRFAHMMAGQPQSTYDDPSVGVGSGVRNQTMGQTYGMERDAIRGDDARAEAGAPDAYTGAKILTSLPRYMAAPAKGALGAAASMAQSGLESFMTSNAAPGSADSNIQTALGGAVGLGGHLLGVGASKGATALMKWYQAAERVVQDAIASGKQEAITAAMKMLQEKQVLLQELTGKAAGAVGEGTSATAAPAASRAAVGSTPAAVVGSKNALKATESLPAAKQAVEDAGQKVMEAKLGADKFAVREEAKRVIDNAKPIRKAAAATLKGGVGGAILPGITSKVGAVFGLADSVIQQIGDPAARAATRRTLVRIALAPKIAKLAPQDAAAYTLAATRAIVNEGSKGFFEWLNTAVKADPKLGDVVKKSIPEEKHEHPVNDGTDLNDDETQQLIAPALSLTQE